MSIKTFIFDFFGVISHPVLNGWYAEHMLKRGLVDENVQKVFNRFDLGEASEDDIVDYFSKYEGISSTKEELRKEIDSFLVLDKTLMWMIKKLKDKGYKTVILSNANSAFFERKVYTQHPELKSLFNEIIISSDIGMVKPNNDIYLYALKRIDSKPGESLFIDDRKVNLDTATDLGINGFLYTDVISFSEYIKSLGINLDN